MCIRDRCIAADPTKADAYYQKGLNMMGKATLQGDKMVAAPGTAEAFNKYLELAPTGPNAQNAKDMLASIGASVPVSYTHLSASPIRIARNPYYRDSRGFKFPTRSSFNAQSPLSRRKGRAGRSLFNPLSVLRARRSPCRHASRV